MSQRAVLPTTTRLRLALMFMGPIGLWVWAARTLGVRVDQSRVLDKPLLRKSEESADRAARAFLWALPVVVACTIIANVLLTPAILVALSLAQLPPLLDGTLALAGAVFVLAVALGPFLLMVRRSYRMGAPTVSIAAAVIRDPSLAGHLTGHPQTRYAVARLAPKAKRARILTSE